jgi:hypothetical protein
MQHFRLSLAILAIAAFAACGGGKSSSNAGSNGTSNAGSTAGTNDGGAMTSGTAAQMPNCGAVRPVWVNLRTKKYHEQGDPAYGNTRHGEYLCPSAARQQGFVPAGGSGAHHRHHRYRSDSGSNSSGSQSGTDQSGGDNSNP